MTGKWISAIDSSPPLFTPETSGWLLENGMYRIKWFEGAISPGSIEVISCDGDNYDDDSNDDSLHFEIDEEDVYDDGCYSESEDFDI